MKDIFKATSNPRPNMRLDNLIPKTWNKEVQKVDPY